MGLTLGEADAKVKPKPNDQILESIACPLLLLGLKKYIAVLAVRA
jgi:hypothetical protein